MSDSNGLGGAGTGPTQGDQARTNMAREGFAALRGPMSERDVSRPPNYVIREGSSTKQQATGGQP